MEHLHEKIVIGHIKSNLVLQLYKGSNYETNKTQSTKTNKQKNQTNNKNKQKENKTTTIRISHIFVTGNLESLYDVLKNNFFTKKWTNTIGKSISRQ